MTITTTTAYEGPSSPETAEDEAPAAPEGWQCRDEEAASWAIDRVLTARARIDRVTTQASILVARLQKELDRTEGYFFPHLEDYLRANPPAKGRTLHLLTGSLALRTKPGGARVRDQDAAVAWAREHLPAAIMQRPAPSPTVDAASIKAHVEMTGEVPDGVDVVDAVDVFDVKAPKGGAA